MKQFLGIATWKKAKYCANITVKVYRIKNNVPEYIDEIKYNSGSTKGEESEVYECIVNHKQLPMKSYKEQRGYYRYATAHEQRFNISIIWAN